jgi:hypothetical protein
MVSQFMFTLCLQVDNVYAQLPETETFFKAFAVS